MALLFSTLLIMSVSPLLLLPAPSQSLSSSSSSSSSLSSSSLLSSSLSSSSSSSLSSSSSSSPATTTNAKIEVRIADVASDLSAIRDCRRSAYEGKPANLPAAKSFCDADQITRDGYVCVVATAAAEGEGGEKAAVVVVGTADLNTRTGVVNNVYVREEARKRGIARSMMAAVEDYYYARWTAGEGGDDDDDGKKKGRRRKKLSLTVMSKNLPAVGLYKSLGYAAPGVYGGLDALSSMSPLNFLIEMEKEISSPLYLGS